MNDLHESFLWGCTVLWVSVAAGVSPPAFAAGREPPAIVTQPTGQTVLPGALASFTVEVSSKTAPTYQWRFATADLLESSKYSGVTTPTLRISDVTPQDTGDYSVVVSNRGGAITSAVATLALASADSCLPPPGGLIGWWPGDGSARDLVGTNHGTLEGGATADSNGMVGAAFNFDGTNKYVQIPDAPELNPQILSVECWVRFDNLDAPGTSVYLGQQYLVFKQNERSDNFEGYVLSKDRTFADVILWEVTSASGQLVRIDTTSTVTTNVWYHLAGTRGSNFIQSISTAVWRRRPVSISHKITDRCRCILGPRGKRIGIGDSMAAWTRWLCTTAC